MRSSISAFVCAAILVACGPSEDIAQTSDSVEAGADVILRANLQGAIAVFSDVTGCIRTDAFVLTNLEAARTVPSPPVVGTIVSVFVFAENICTGEVLRRAECITDDISLDVSSNLGTAVLAATCVGRDLTTGESLTFTISLTWTATEPPTAITNHAQDRSIPGFFIQTNLRELARVATAVGTISDGTFNYTPSPSIEGEIEDVQQGQVVIRRDTRF
jgi:hypothetical protein